MNEAFTLVHVLGAAWAAFCLGAGVGYVWCARDSVKIFERKIKELGLDR